MTDTAPGRPGRAVTTRGSSAAAHAPATTPAGYEPAELDTMLRSYVAAAEKSIRITESIGTKAEEAVTALIEQVKKATDFDGALMTADALTKLHERLTKANLNLVKSTDELTRLRSFLAGGPDSRPDLTVKGEIELRAILFAAVKAQGFKLVNADGVEVAA